MDNAQTKALITELTDAGIPASPSETDAGIPTSPVSSIKGGANQGTYVAKELVYAYAMWINPKFHVMVIQAFDAMVQGKDPHIERTPKRPRKPAFDTTYTRLLKIARTLPNTDENQQCMAAARGTFEMTGVNPLELMGMTSLAAPNDDTYLTPTEIGHQIAATPREVNQLLVDQGYQTRHAALSSSCDYRMTEKGAPFGRMFDTTRRNGKGSQAQLKWSNRIVKHLLPFSRPKEAAS
ncbi:KilA-N domain-containing protein [Asaia bogorensis]|uniref:KilA-N domain-containing protein n=1 Tax=Asaia bogorensis TaxID=91915 RepID=UPI000EFD4E2F|nr:KilA-N domain-containing protein [Asaia bogorensis]